MTNVVSLGGAPVEHGKPNEYLIEAQRRKPNNITFRANTATWVMRITPDRKIEVNEDVEVSVAARAVLDAVQQMLRPRAWVGLTDEEYMEIVMLKDDSPQSLRRGIEAKLKEKNAST